MSAPVTWHYEGHYILTDSEPQVVIAERVSEANRELIASAPELQAKIEALADALEKILLFTDDHEAEIVARVALRAAGRIS